MRQSFNKKTNRIRKQKVWCGLLCGLIIGQASSSQLTQSGITNDCHSIPVPSSSLLKQVATTCLRNTKGQYDFAQNILKSAQKGKPIIKIYVVERERHNRRGISMERAQSSAVKGKKRKSFFENKILLIILAKYLPPNTCSTYVKGCCQLFLLFYM